MRFLSEKNFIPEEAKIICGLDEVGRGPWAGPLIACALIIKQNLTKIKVKDSKQLTPSQREEIFEILQQKTCYGIGIVEVHEIDRLGIIQATNTAFIRAIESLPLQPDFLLVDGKDKLILPYPFRSIIKGDQKIKVIACASIIAKVVRDHMMMKLSEKYPRYRFDEHKGYGTKKHFEALKIHGPCEIHRKSFKPVQAFLNA